MTTAVLDRPVDEVDTEVELPAPFTRPRVGSMFSGYGGLDGGIHDAFGGETVFVADVCKVNADGSVGHHDVCRAPCSILAHRFPDAPNLGDVSAIDWDDVAARLLTAGGIDILCAGFPCQDVSHAGKRAGLMHGTRSGLWHEVVRAITALRPPLVVLENVRGLLSARGDTSVEFEAAELRIKTIDRLKTWITDRRDRAAHEGRTADARRLADRTHRLMGLRRRAVADRGRAERRIVRAIGTVLGTLADLGYDAAWYCLRASDVGAPHGRFRIFIVAWPADATSVAWGLVDRDDAAAADHDGEGRRGVGRFVDGEHDADGRDGAHRDGDAGEPASLLPTPAAYDGSRGGAQDADKRRAGGHSVTLQDAVHGMPSEEKPSKLLPTPLTTDGGSNSPGDRARKDPTLRTMPHLLPTPVTDPDSGNGHARDLGSEARSLLPTPRAGDGTKGGPNQRGSSGDLMLPSAAVQLLPTPNGFHSQNTESPDEWLERRRDVEERTGTRHGPALPVIAWSIADGTPLVQDGTGPKLVDPGTDRWGPYADAVHRWEHVTRPAPDPTETSPKGTPRLNARFSEWMMGLPDGWITDVPDITRNEALKACGNGVVPQQAAAALRWLWPHTPYGRAS